MKFSTTSTSSTAFTSPPPPPPKPSNYFFSQPHQPFFFFGVVWAIVSMVIFTLSHKGIFSLSIAENTFHLYSLSFIVIIQFFHGFLFTTYPRFCLDDAIPLEEYIPTVWTYQIFTVLFFVGSITSVSLTIIGMLGIFFAHAMSITTLFLVYRSGKSPLKSDPFWMLIAHVFGIIAHVLVLLMIALEQFETSWDGVCNPYYHQSFFGISHVHSSSTDDPFFQPLYGGESTLFCSDCVWIIGGQDGGSDGANPPRRSSC